MYAYGMKRDIILVDQNDQVIGQETKLKTHQEGRLHRAFSIFIFNSEKELLIQKRAKAKYHSPNLWSNTCCSHPKSGEDLLTTAHRRLKEEMGFDSELKEMFNFIYKIKFSNGLTEHEFDHVIVGKFDGTPKINPKEVSEFKWIGIKTLSKDIKKNPENYTYWLKMILPKLISSKIVF